MSLQLAELVALHRELVRTASVSGDEAAVLALAANFLERHGVAVERVGGSLLAGGGARRADPERPLVLFDTHLDTVPVAPGWTRPPHDAEMDDEKIYGLGANDAKASAAAMISAAVGHHLRASRRDGGFDFALALVRDEERRSAGTEEIVAELARRGVAPAAVVVGEPTGLDLAVAQRGLMVLELVAHGEAAHAAHARSLGAKNAATALARDLVALERLAQQGDGPVDALLGRATFEPTMLSGGSARNVVPAEARAVVDCRTVPAESPEALRARLARHLEGELVVISDRLRPVATDPHTPLVEAARRARPEAKIYGSATMSDMTFFRDRPAIKVGPGESSRSHRPDEFVTVGELAAGAAFYERLLAELEVAFAAGAGRATANPVEARR